MNGLGSKRMLIQLTACAFWLVGTMPCPAQMLSISMMQDPEVLVSKPRPSSSTANGSAGQNLESSLVDITTLGAPVMRTENGKTGLASEEHYGQGVIIDPAGIIVTNKHIVADAQHIYVALVGGKTYEARVLSVSQSDLCLIKIDARMPLRAVSLADPSQIQIGNNVTAFANAKFNPQRKLGGQVINMFADKDSNKVELLEMNIPLRSGDSGGPILNEQGALLGLIMANLKSDPSKSYAVASSRIQQEYYNYRNSILN